MGEETSITVAFVDPDGRLEPVGASLAAADPSIETVSVLSPAALVDRFGGEAAAMASDATVTAATGPDCVVVLDAPGVDGIAELEGVMAVVENVPVVLFSIDNDADLVWRALGRGAADVVCVDADRQTLLTRRIRHAAGKGESFQTDAALLESLLEHLPHQIFIKDDEGRIADASAVTAAEYGFTRDQLVGLTDFELLAPDSAEAAHDEEQHIMSTGEPVVNKVEHYTDDDGNDHWVSTTKAARYNDRGEPVGIIGTTRNVTEEKRQEQMMNALHEASRDLVAAETKGDIRAATADITEGIPDLPLVAVALADGGDLHADSDGGGDTVVFEAYRDAFETAHRTGTEVFVEERSPLLEPEDEEPDQRDRAEVAQPNEADTEVDDAELAELVDGDLTPRTAEDDEADDAAGPVAVVLPLGDHGALGVANRTGTFNEFTLDLARTLAAHLEASLERAEREQQLRQRERTLERQNERLEEFASIISHDIRNPLSVAQGYLEMVEDTGDPSYASEVRESLERIDTLTEELLTLARKGQVVGETEPVSMADAARDAWANVDAGDAALSVEGDVVIDADRERVLELLENLFRNAIDHALPADGAATNGGGDPLLTVSVGALSDANGTTGFYVADDGVGIPADEREEVLEMGYTTADDGTGFGLYIVATVAQAHGWEVDVVESETGGTRIEVRT